MKRTAPLALLVAAAVAVVIGTNANATQPVQQQPRPSSTPAETLSEAAPGTPALLGLPEPTEAEKLAQVALNQPPTPPVISSAAQAAAAKVTDKAKQEERLGQTRRFDGNFFTPAPAAIKANRSSDEAQKLAANVSKPPKAQPDSREFALFTGGPADMGPGGSAGAHKYQNRPVWVFTYNNIEWTAGSIGGPTNTAVINSTVMDILDDATGALLIRVQSTG